MSVRVWLLFEDSLSHTQPNDDNGGSGTIGAIRKSAHELKRSRRGQDVEAMIASNLPRRKLCGSVAYCAAGVAVGWVTKRLQVHFLYLGVS